MAKIYLIRHCESEGNACRRTQAQTDALVTTKGYLQSEALRRRFQGIAIDGLYSSDAYRSILTLEPIAKERGLPIRVRIHLREITTGVWEDMAWGNIAQEYPQASRDWEEHPWAHTTPGASTFQQAADRLVFGLRRIAREVGEGTALCVSHSCTIKAGLCSILGRPLSDVKVVGHGDNTSVSLIHVDEDGRFSVEYMNDCSHLPPELCRAWSGVAGDDVNMAVDPVDLSQETQCLLDLARSWASQSNASGAVFDEKTWLAEAEELIKSNPEYLALCRLKGKPVGFVWMEKEAEMPCDCGHIRTMFVLPELQNRGYTEQLFGYAAHVFRYQGKRRLTIQIPRTAEEQRVMERFTFVPMRGFQDRMVLELFSPPCPYPILA
ncbi:GNAT family N-acetyltransferase [Lawsonibacter sp. LCP25S3_G6]|uniref:GNAT family N-acetyltransferase n=1 Tax=unclassified Lawsonibacter TaxID=2617946 RepID=UPI003F972D36